MTAAERQHLAEKWRCSERTIKRWVVEGAPFGDDKRMRSWLACRKNLPPKYAATVGTGAIERAVMLRRQGLFTAAQVVEMGNQTDSAIYAVVSTLHALSAELANKPEDVIRARLLSFEQQIFKDCLCTISEKVNLYD